MKWNSLMDIDIFGYCPSRAPSSSFHDVITSPHFYLLHSYSLQAIEMCLSPTFQTFSTIDSYFLQFISKILFHFSLVENSFAITTASADPIPPRNVDYNPLPLPSAGALETALSVARVDAFLSRIRPHNFAPDCFFLFHAVRASTTLLHIPRDVG